MVASRSKRSLNKIKKIRLKISEIQPKFRPCKLYTSLTSVLLTQAHSTTTLFTTSTRGSHMSHTENDCYFSELPESRLSHHDDFVSLEENTFEQVIPEHVWYGPPPYGSNIESFPASAHVIESEQPLLFEGQLYTGLVKSANGQPVGFGTLETDLKKKFYRESKACEFVHQLSTKE